MKLYKSILLLVAVFFITILPGCSAQQYSVDEVKQYADPMTENILLAMNEDNYARFSQDFDEQMKKGLNETQYNNTIPGMKGKIGDYLAKEIIGMENKDQFIVVTYKATFSEEPSSVIVRSVFRDINGQKYISGFWMDSPKLRGN